MRYEYIIRCCIPATWEVLYPEEVGLSEEDIQPFLDSVKERHLPDDVVYMDKPFIAIGDGASLHVCREIVCMGGVSVFLDILAVP